VTRDALVVFVKAPRPGAAKTRLIPALGADAAAALYRVLAEEAVRRTAPAAGEYDRFFFFAPDDARAEMEAWLGGRTWLPQQGRDLGGRMAAAFEAAFREGARRVALIGTDVPGISRDRVLEALSALDGHGLVLGPARDGGYYLIALDRPRAGLFDDIPWGTSGVLTATMARARALGLRVRLLEPLADIDTIDDIRAEWPSLEPLLAGTAILKNALSRALDVLSCGSGGGSMEDSRLSKTPKLGVVLQITEIVPSGIDGRAWEVHDVERSRGFRVTLTDASSAKGSVTAASGGEAPDEAIERAIGVAIERALESPPEKTPGTLYHVELTPQELRETVKPPR
jgi:rSAM/selenodomain-associated transferase 1